jgi:putative Ca2+/H+ antiporter (TMEM165/GDT1 family)
MTSAPARPRSAARVSSDTGVSTKAPRSGPSTVPAPPTIAGRRPWIVFLAEMGDKTQLATVALGARYHSTVAVTAGTTAGMMLADGLAVFAGTTLTRVLPMARLRLIAALLFFAFGLTAITASLGLF